MTTASGHTSAIRAKKVIGTDVKDTSGATIGKIEDIMLDKQSSNIMYAVVGFGGFLGMG
jgi:sporulation protein YlmC with PRC-barrel domain